MADERCGRIVGRCCEPLLEAEHHVDAEPDCRCRRRHHAIVEGHPCNLLRGEHDAADHEFLAAEVA